MLMNGTVYFFNYSNNRTAVVLDKSADVGDDVAGEIDDVIILQTRKCRLSTQLFLLLLSLPLCINMEFRVVDFPVEIQEVIFDFLFGEKNPAPRAPGEQPKSRQARGKSLSCLAMVCPLWRSLVQRRVYHHIKIRGSVAELNDSVEWFRAHPHLMEYVKHIEIWVPVWGRPSVRRRHFTVPRQPVQGWTVDGQAILADNNRYQRAHDNASLNDIFRVVKAFFASAQIFTLEGGDNYRSLRVEKFADGPLVFGFQDRNERRRLPVLDHVKTFVMRGAWNVMRDSKDWYDFRQALPNITEWQCSYTRIQVLGSEYWLPLTYQLAGINHTEFNDAFHEMVLGAVQALTVLPKLSYLRIRFMDLDWTDPFQNPYFELKNDKCTGLWSPAILDALRESRPSASFVQRSNGIEPEIVDNVLVGVQALAARPVSILASQYVIIAENRLP
ncbi:hypothetical protein MYU51_021049 [Penicillium brevicompactum]